MEIGGRKEKKEIEKENFEIKIEKGKKKNRDRKKWKIVGGMGNFVSAENAKKIFLTCIIRKNAEKGARVGLFSEGKFSRFCACGKSVPQFPPISPNFRNVGRGLQFVF